eukprot:m.39027 g.39027  ORF g.39027 m.39027 type:complete len:54 (-) comp11552_c0_seq1:236-397(-)
MSTPGTPQVSSPSASRMAGVHPPCTPYPTRRRMAIITAHPLIYTHAYGVSPAV